MSKITKYVSIGYSCAPKYFISTAILKENYYVFDYIGTSMWSVIELINNNFEDFITDEIIKKILIDTKKTLMYTNKKYYVRFIHDICDQRIKLPNYLENLKTTYERRITRFFELLADHNVNNKLLCFLRTEENNTNRIIHDEHKHKFDKSEHYYICEFSNLIKTKYPTMKFIILYINYSDNLIFDKNNKIIFFSKTLKEDGMCHFVDHVKHIISNNDIYINNCINEIYPDI